MVVVWPQDATGIGIGLRHITSGRFKDLYYRWEQPDKRFVVIGNRNGEKLLQPLLKMPRKEFIEDKEAAFEKALKLAKKSKLAASLEILTAGLVKAKKLSQRARDRGERHLAGQCDAMGQDLKKMIKECQGKLQRPKKTCARKY